MATQFFFTLCFIGMLLAIIFIIMYLLCINEYYRVSVLRWTGLDLIISGTWVSYLEAFSNLISYI